jgi:glycosyltransferase involved in cell wall biosynthesis
MLKHKKFLKDPKDIKIIFLIKKCLPSFLKTKVEDVQFIIIDNNSDDGTWNYLQSVARNDKRVEIYKNSQNIGATKSIF